jgi:hypothetical protein
MKQTTFASLAFDHKKKQTRRETFLAEMERAVPWTVLLVVIEPYYPTSGRRGRQPYPLATMLRLAYAYIAQLIDLGDPELENYAAFTKLLAKRLDGIPPEAVDLQGLALTGYDIKPRDGSATPEVKEPPALLPIGPGGAKRGDALHAVLCGAGHNLRLLMKRLRLLWPEIRDWLNARLVDNRINPLIAPA